MKVAIYTRVSTGNEEQLTSMANQKEYYQNYCRQHDYDLVNIYADEGLTGTNPKRKAYLEMLYDAGLDVIRDQDTSEISFKVSGREPKFEMIITKDVSRYARNIDAMGVAKKLEEKKVYILFENAGFSTKDPDWQLRLSLLLTFTQQESLDRSKKVGFAYKQRAEKGKFHMSRPLYGYESCLETEGYKIVEEEAEVVREIFNLYVNENMGAKAISSELNKRGLKTRLGKNWRADGVKRMVNNEKYKGQVVISKLTKTSVTGSNRTIKRDKDQWKVYDDAIPAIVDAEIWDKAQVMMKERTNITPNGNKYGSRTVKSVFHKKIVCSKCFADFIRIANNKEKFGEKVTEYIYQCRNKRMHQTCDEKGVSHNVLERTLTKFARDSFHKHLDIEIKSQLNMKTKIMKILEDKIQKVELTRKNIQEQINNIDNDTNKLLDNFLSNNVNETVKNAINRKIEALESDRLKLEEELSNNTVIEYEKYIEKVEKRFEEVLKVYNKKTFTFEDVLNYIKNISLSEADGDRWMSISLNVPSLKPFYIEQTADEETLKYFTSDFNEVGTTVVLKDKIKLI